MPILWSAVALHAAAEQRCDTSAYALSSPTAQFVDHGDGTVTDTRYHLMWMRCSAGQQWARGSCQGQAADADWASASAAAKSLNDGGTLFFDDWRVPQLRELATIAERECSDPRINLTVFPNTPADWYWSATPRRSDTGAEAAFALSFGVDGVKYRNKQEGAHVRLVRYDP